MKKIILLSDTHSFCEKKLDPYLTQADEIWHAGDWGSQEVISWLQSFNKILRGVYGNIDGAEIRIQFPEDTIFHLEGFKIWMTHIGGYPGRYASRVRDLMPQHNPNLFVCGHSHILKVQEDKKHNLWSINPGACGREGFHIMKTALTFTLDNGKLQNFEVIDLGKRGKI